MANYTYTTEPGTSRRRAKRIIIDNPAGLVPILTFEMEDRIILSDGASAFVPQGYVSLVVDEVALDREYEKFDIYTGAKLEGTRSGKELLDIVFPIITDIFVATATEYEEGGFSEDEIMADTGDTPPPAEPEVEKKEEVLGGDV